MFGRLVPIEVPFGSVIGGALALLGLAIMLGAALQLLAGRTTVIPGRDPSRMMTGGLYRFSRNPIYLADAILLAGLFVYWGALIALPLVALFMLLISKRFIADEETRLERLFGEEWQAYKSRTRRWI
jgi:protein-S-isoprenylcysteine O-methyltransferase Ste14